MVLDDKLDIKLGDKVSILRDPDTYNRDDNHNVAVTGFISEINSKSVKLAPFVVGAPNGNLLFTNQDSMPYYPIAISEQGSIITKSFQEHEDKIKKEEGYLRDPQNKRVHDYLKLAKTLENTQ